MRKYKLLIAFCAIFLSVQISFAQNNPIIPVGIGEKMGDFKLETYQGKEINSIDLKGKNIMLVFPRGKVLPEMWCPLCYYQYAELAEYERMHEVSKKLDLEIFYVLPYPKDSIDLWKQSANAGLQSIENWKNPPGFDTLKGPAKDWAIYVREFFPEKYEFKMEDGYFNIPILIDDKKELSKGMYLYTKEWGGTQAAQNMPTVFIMDKEGVVKFKYHSQYTNDRPTTEYLIEYIKKMM